MIMPFEIFALLWYNYIKKNTVEGEMFEKGSYVIYRSEGVCVISDVRSESFGAIGGAETYYVLSPIREPRSTVFVPVENERLVAFMRPLMNAAQITAMVNEEHGERLEWLADSRARGNIFKEILARGDRRELVRLVNTLSEKHEEARNRGAKCCASELGLLERAKKMLFDEFSATTDLNSVDEIMPVLRGERVLSDRKISEQGK